jgi:hypothetical protein
MKKRGREEIQKRISKQTVWCDDVCDHELSRSVGKKLEGAGALVWRLIQLWVTSLLLPKCSKAANLAPKT